jgi:ubiquinone/menaquinone biosynthesis C-methylase UbiE
MSLNLKKYENYIDNNKNLTTCQKKIFIEYRKVINTIYVDQKSNYQISTLIDNIHKNNKLYYKSKLQTMLLKFFNKQFSEIIYRHIEHNPKITDDEIIEYIINKRHKYKNNTKTPIKLGLQICNEWTYIIQLISLKYKQLIENLNGKYDSSKIKYVDIGMGRGNKTYKIANELGLVDKNVSGADIKIWGPYNQENIKHKVNFIEIEDGKINAKDNSFDFASCILMLHHVKDLDNFILEIKRILKPDGILLIIEHNIYDDYDHLMLDVLHFLYEILVDKNKEYRENPAYSSYYNWVEWNFILKKFNFNFLENNVLFSTINDEVRYDNIFYSFFINKKN